MDNELHTLDADKSEELAACDCEGWQKCAPILFGQQMLASNRGCSVEYPKDGIFIYCPWCGEKRASV